MHEKIFSGRKNIIDIAGSSLKPAKSYKITTHFFLLIQHQQVPKDHPSSTNQLMIFHGLSWFCRVLVVGKIHRHTERKPAHWQVLQKINRISRWRIKYFMPVSTTQGEYKLQTNKKNWTKSFKNGNSEAFECFNFSNRKLSNYIQQPKLAVLRDLTFLTYCI